MITDKIKLLKENDLIVGSYVYCSDKKNLEYYKYFGLIPKLKKIGGLNE